MNTHKVCWDVRHVTETCRMTEWTSAAGWLLMWRWKENDKHCRDENVQMDVKWKIKWWVQWFWLKQSRCDGNRNMFCHFHSFITELGYGFSNVSSGSNKNKQVKWKTDKLSIDLINSVLIITGLFIINDTDVYLSQEVVNQKPRPLTNWWSHWLAAENQWANEGSAWWWNHVMVHGSMFQCFSGH